jgi:hypothetical protein
LDFTELGYSSINVLNNSLEDFITRTAMEYAIDFISRGTPDKFSELIEKLHEKRGEEVVILVDEYDKPLIDNLNREVYSEVKRTLHDFYQVIKAKVKHERFVFLTGVSRFSGLSIFSGLNNLIDITMESEFGTICGYTQEELESNFKEYIENAAEEMGLNKKELLSEIKRWYNGYSWDGKTFVYNPFSTLAFFSNKEFKDYWFATGTPTFLIEQIKKRNDLEIFIEAKVVNSSSLRGRGDTNIENIAMMFQTGYLTIKKKEIIEYEPRYTIDFPNMEVKKAFLSRLMAACARKSQEEVDNIRGKIIKALKEKRAEELQRGLVELFANIAYDLITQKESYYHSLFLVAGVLSGYEVEPEVHTDKGRIDAVLKKGKEVIVVEIKYGKGSKVGELLKEAMEQIKDRKYYEKYGGSEVSLLAIAFGDNKEIACKFEQK